MFARGEALLCGDTALLSKLLTILLITVFQDLTISLRDRKAVLIIVKFLLIQGKY